MNFAEQLKEARRLAGLSQQKLSDLTEIPLRTIQHWEAGDRKPKEYTQKQLLSQLETLSNK